MRRFGRGDAWARCSPREEWGVATAVVVSLVGVVLSVALGVATVLSAAVAHRRAQAASDLAALAGAAAAQQGEAPCTAAAEVAVANRTRLAGCVVEGDDVLVRVVVEVPGAPGFLGEVGGRARAGPS